MAGTVICLHVPRFELITAVVREGHGGVATGEGGEAGVEGEGLLGRALALAPLPGAGAFVGEVSGAAEALGVRAGMRLGEALARAPRLELVAPDPVGVAEAWELLAGTLEGIGARPELERVGIAHFQADGLYGLYGGLDGVMAATRRALAGVSRGPAAQGLEGLGAKGLAAICSRARLGAGPTRLCALMASRERPRRGGRRAGTQQARERGAPLAPVGEAGARRYLAPLSVEVLRLREETRELVDPLRRLGIGTLGELAELPRAAVADRFGRPGLLAHDLACGHDDRLRERPPREHVQESIELEESTGPALDHALGVLLDRLLARPERRARTLRALILSAGLVEGGTWLERVVLRQASVERERIRMTLSLRLALLPAPAQRLTLRVEGFGGPDVQQRALMEEGRALRLERLREAARQVRAGAGLEGALRIVAVDELSRVPERRFLLTPFS